MSKAERHTIPCAELPAIDSGETFSREWGTYRREVARLLAEGHEGKFALIKGDHVISVHGTWDAAREEGLRLYLLEPFLVHQVCTAEPVLRLRGYSLPCPSRLTP